MIKDSDERLELAKKFNCHHIIIDVWYQLLTLKLIIIRILACNLLFICVSGFCIQKRS